MLPLRLELEAAVLYLFAVDLLANAIVRVKDFVGIHRIGGRVVINIRPALLTVWCMYRVLELLTFYVCVAFWLEDAAISLKSHDSVVTKKAKEQKVPDAVIYRILH